MAQHDSNAPESTSHSRLTVWFDRPLTFWNWFEPVTPMLSSIVRPNRLPVFSTSRLLPATRMYCAGTFSTASPLIAPAMLTLPVVVTSGKLMNERPYVGTTGGNGGIEASQPLLPMNSLRASVVSMLAPMRPTPVGATMRPPAPTTMPLALARKTAGAVVHPGQPTHPAAVEIRLP